MILLILIAPVALFLLLYISSINWKRSVVFVLVFVILEGVARKWILPGASNFIYFVKDFVLIGAYIKYFWIEGRKARSHPINVFIFILAIWCLVQSFNPSLGSFVIGLFGLRAYILYIPLFWILPDLFSSKLDLYIFIRNYSLLIIPACLLAVAQFFSPPSSPLNFYTPGSGPVANFGVGTEEIIRVTGPFPYITGFATYISFSLALLLPLLTLQQPRIWYLLTVTELILLLGTAFMTGSRGLILFEVLFVLIYICVLLVKNSSQAFRNIIKFLFPAAAGAIIIPVFFEKSIKKFTERTVTHGSSEQVSRIWSPFLEPINVLTNILKYKRLDSYGTGATHQATPMIQKILQLPAGELIMIPAGEGESYKVGIEIGVIGFFAWYLIRVSLIISLVLTLIKIRDPFLAQLALASLLFHGLYITAHVIFNATMGIYFWFFAGFIILLPELEKQGRKIALNNSNA